MPQHESEVDSYSREIGLNDYFDRENQFGTVGFAKRAENTQGLSAYLDRTQPARPVVQKPVEAASTPEPSILSKIKESIQGFTQGRRISPSSTVSELDKSIGDGVGKFTRNVPLALKETVTRTDVDTGKSIPFGAGTTEQFAVGLLENAGDLLKGGLKMSTPGLAALALDKMGLKAPKAWLESDVEITPGVELNERSELAHTFGDLGTEGLLIGATTPVAAATKGVLLAKGYSSMVQIIGKEAAQSLALLPSDIERFGVKQGIIAAIAGTAIGGIVEKALLKVGRGTIGELASELGEELGEREGAQVAVDLAQGRVPAIAGKPPIGPEEAAAALNMGSAVRQVEPRIGVAPPTPPVRSSGEFLTVERPGSPTKSLRGPLGEKVTYRVDGEDAFLVTIDKGRAPNSESAVAAFRKATSEQGLNARLESFNQTAEGAEFLNRGQQAGRIVQDERGFAFAPEPPARTDTVIGGGEPPPGARGEPIPEGTPDKVGNILITGKRGDPKFDAEAGFVESLQDVTRLFGADVSVARRGVQTTEETIAAANEILSSPRRIEELFNRPAGSAFNAEEVTALRRFTLAKTTATVDKARLMINAVEGSQERINAREAYSAAFNEQRIVQLKLHGAAAESGRAQRAFRLQATQPEFDVSKFDLNDMTLKQQDDVAAQMVAAADDPEAIAGFVLRVPSFLDKLHELRIAMMLTSPIGRTRDLASNAAFGVFLRPGRKLLEGAVDYVRATATGTPRAVFALEGPIAWKHMGDAIGEALQVGAYAWRTGKSGLGGALKKADISKMLVPTAHGLRFGDKSVEALATRWALTRKMSFISLNVIQAFDDFSKVISASGDLGALAYREAKRQVRIGKSTKGLAATMADLRAEPTRGMLKDMNLHALQDTLQDTNAVSKYVTKLRQHEPGRWIAPFVRTQANISKWLAEHDLITGTTVSVVRGVKHKVRQFQINKLLDKTTDPKQLVKLKAELKANTFTPVEFAENVAKPMIGGVFYAGTYLAVSNGVVTGGRPFPESGTGKLVKPVGWQAYSFKVGDKYIRYDRFPFGQMMGMAANAAIAIQAGDSDASDRVAIVMRGMYDQILQPGWMRSFQDFMGAMPGSLVIDQTSRVGGDFLLSFMPSIMRHVAEIHEGSISDETYRRQQETISQRWQQMVPGLRTDVPFVLDDRGQKISQVYGFNQFIGPTRQIRSEADLSVGLSAEKVAAVRFKFNDFGYKGDTDALKLVSLFQKHTPEEVVAKTRELLDRLEALQVEPIKGQRQKQKIGAITGVERFPIEDRRQSIFTLDALLKARWIAFNRLGDREGMISVQTEARQRGFQHRDFRRDTPKELEEGLEAIRP